MDGSPWFLALLAVNEEHVTLSRYPDGLVVLYRGYYMIMAQRDPEGKLIYCIPQSNRLPDEAAALAAWDASAVDESGPIGVSEHHR